MNKPAKKQQVTRRDWLNLSMMFSALLLSPRVSAAPLTSAAANKIAFPIICEDDEDGSIWTPDHYKYEDVRNIVFSTCGYDSPFSHNDIEVLAILWRFRSLSDAEAVEWLRRLHADMQQAYAIEYAPRYRRASK